MSENGPSRSPCAARDSEKSSFLKTLRKWLGGFVRNRNGDKSLRQIVEAALAERDGDAEAIDPEKRRMLVNLLRFGDLEVKDVMVPRADIVAIEESTLLAEVVAELARAGHSRLPVYRDNLDDVIGMVHIRDLLPYWGANKPLALTEVCRRILFVPPSMPVLDVLLQMQVTRIHMALVVDEYGGTDGLVTIEDLVEEIVGEIEDEHDTEDRPMLVEKPGGVLDANARTPIGELEARVGYSLLPEDREEDIDTLGGLVFSLVGRVPGRGELIAHPSGLEFEVIDADPRRIKRLRVHHLPPSPAAE
ncbi:MAG: hemolysin family protein [Alphaproteobacteria bacterium]